jgi:hypothetical protein
LPRSVPAFCSVAAGSLHTFELSGLHHDRGRNQNTRRTHNPQVAKLKTMKEEPEKKNQDRRLKTENSVFKAQAASEP